MTRLILVKRSNPVLSFVLVLAIVSALGCSSPELPPAASEVVIVDGNEAPDANPLPVTGANGDTLGELYFDGRVSGSGFVYTSSSGARAVFWHPEETPNKDVRLITLRHDGRTLAAYSVVFGALGSKTVIDLIDTTTAETKTQTLDSETWTARVEGLRGAAS